eukprot:404224-Pelagomonas_calceolata.AAC.1
MELDNKHWSTAASGSLAQAQHAHGITSDRQELTAVRFDDAGLQVAVGTRNGLVGVYDLRSQRPVVVKDHMYGSKLNRLWFVNLPMHDKPGMFPLERQGVLFRALNGAGLACYSFVLLVLIHQHLPVMLASLENQGPAAYSKVPTILMQADSCQSKPARMHD